MTGKQQRTWVSVMLAAVLLATVTCGGDSDTPTAPAPAPPPPPAPAPAPAPEPESLALSFTGLESLGDGFVYEGWILVDGAPVSTGTFTVDADGNLSQDDFAVDDGTMLSAATKFILTIEPSPDSDPAPAATKYLAGDFDGDAAALSVADPVTLGDDFASASGSFILETPSTADVPEDYASGIWWLDPADHSATLTLPTLPAGWAYEGWVVGADGPVTTGRFTEAMGADSDGAGPTAGPDSAPPFPGQDFIDPLVSLIGYLAVVSIEPDPDNSPGPFTLKPLVDMDIEDVGRGMPQSMVNITDMFPTGMASR